MKKILILFLFILSTLMVVSCSKNVATYSFKITGSTALRTSVVINYEFKDEDNQLANSEVRYAIYQEGSDEVVTSGEFNKTISTITISSLNQGTSYIMDVTTAFDNKAVTIIGGYKFETSSLGTSAENPYLISEASEFRTMLQNDYTGYYKLTNDLDFSGAGIDPLFTSKSTYFAGVFDGDGHSIKNFNLGIAPKTETDSPTNHTYSTTYGGIFGGISDTGVVKNLVIEDSQFYVFRSSTAYFAFVAGYNAGTIQNVTVKNSSLYVKGTTNVLYAGGIAGHNFSAGLIEDCHLENVSLSVSTSASAIVGGIIATNDARESSITTANKVVNCSFEGSIKVVIGTSSTISSQVNAKVGGLVGYNNSYVGSSSVDALITVKTDARNYTSSTFNLYVGGAVGHNLRDGSSVVYGVNVETAISLDAKDAKDIAYGFVVGYNGGSKETSSAQVLGCAFEAKEGENHINAVVDKVSVNNVGLIGVNKASNSEVTFNDSVTVTVNEFETKTNEEALATKTLIVSSNGTNLPE